MAVSLLSQALELDAVADVQVTAIAEADGRFARRIRFYTAPYATGDAPALDVLLRADDADALKLIAPESTF